MTDAGILLGLPRDKAHDLIVQSAIGAATMLRDSGEHPVKLRENVTSRRHHHQRHPRAGEPRRTGRAHRRPRSRPRP
ncbi:Pyrroline-5-carboxylate reductase [Streptomyces glaucescens]